MMNGTQTRSSLKARTIAAVGKWVVPNHYEIRVVGLLDEDAANALAGLDVVSDGTVSVIDADLDQAGLHGVLERIRSLDIELLEIRLVRRHC
jgi:hypothetical protein